MQNIWAKHAFQKDLKKYGMNMQGSNDKKHALCKPPSPPYYPL